MTQAGVFDKETFPVSARLRTILFLILFVAAFFSRLYLLYTTQHYLDGDEALVGMMAVNILEKGEHPLFWYGLHYNGGGSWEAHLGAVMMKVFGFYDIGLKYTAILISLLLLFFLYRWGRENFGDAAALAAVFLYVFSVSFAAWNLKLRGHLTGILCLALLLWIYYRFLFGGKNNWRWALGAGLAAGLSYWCLEATVILTLVFLLFWFYQDRKILRSGNFWLFMSAFVIGLIPIIYENLRYNFANLKHLLLRAPGLDERSVLDKIILTFSHDLPSLFHTDIVHNYPESIAWWGWAGFLMVTAAVFYFICRLAKPMLSWIAGFFRRPGAHQVWQEKNKYLFLLVYLLCYQWVFSFSGFAEASPRYMLPAMPVIFIICALAFIQIFHKGKVWLKSISVLLMLLWAVIGVKENIALAHSYKMIDGYQVTDSRDLTRLVAYMMENKITAVYANKFIQSRVMFYSQGAIAVSRFINREGMVMGNPGISFFPEAERSVAQTHNPAYIFHHNTEIDSLFKEYLKVNSWEYSLWENPSYNLYGNFSGIFTSGDFMAYLKEKRIFSLELWNQL